MGSLWLFHSHGTWRSAYVYSVWVISFSICYWGIVSWREHRMKKDKKQHMENTT